MWKDQGSGSAWLIVLGSCARHSSLTIPPFTHTGELSGNLTRCRGGGEGATYSGLVSHLGVKQHNTSGHFMLQSQRKAPELCGCRINLLTFWQGMQMFAVSMSLVTSGLLCSPVDSTWEMAWVLSWSNRFSFSVITSSALCFRDSRASYNYGKGKQWKFHITFIHEWLRAFN